MSYTSLPATGILPGLGLVTVFVNGIPGVSQPLQIKAAAMILTDDNFATVIKAVESGRAPYDNLLQYIRFELAQLVGFILNFLGSALFNIALGVPFTPDQIL
jgi:magnesium-transporting ATPase (P-type)